MTTKVEAHEPRIARLERSDELDQSSMIRVLDLMDRHVALWQERHDATEREWQQRHASMQREMKEFRDELRSIRDERSRLAGQFDATEARNLHGQS